MFDELLCLTVVAGQKKISIPKLLCRITYLGVGFGSGLLVRFITKDSASSGKSKGGSKPEVKASATVEVE